MKRLIYLMLFCCLTCCVQRTAAQINYAIQYSTTCAATAVTFNSTVFETAQFPGTILWNFGDPASGLLNTAKDIQQPVHIYTTPGSYIISLHVVDAGAGTIDLLDTIDFVLPVAHNFGPDVFLCGDTGTYIINAPVIAGAVYEWNDDTTTLGPVLTVKESGAYTVKINGCEVTDTLGVFFTKEPTLDLGRDHTLCQGERISLDATSENANYQWLLNGTILPATQSQLPVVAPGGQYIVNIDVAGCGAYSDTVNINFSSYVAPPFNLGPDTLLCPKEIFSLTAHVSGASGYAWSSKGLNVDDEVDYNIDMDSTITITAPGRYWAFVTVAKQCEVVDTMIVRYRGNKQLNFNDTAICQGNTLVLDADFGTGIYKWESIPAQRDDQNNTNQSTYYVYKPGFYAVTATVGHCVFKDSLNVVFNDTLQLKMPKDTSLCRGETFLIQPIANAPDYKWQDGTVGGYFNAATTGLYRIIGENGCGRDTAQMNIVFEACPCTLLLPNAFTPNGDGMNDNFRPLHPCDMQDYTMTIFNRYGEKIYFSKDPLEGWDGKLQGTKLTVGGYVWTVIYTKTSTKERIQKQGSIILLQ